MYRVLALSLAGLPFALATCADDVMRLIPDQAVPSLQLTHEQGGIQRQYGEPQRVGNGRARVYVVIDPNRRGAPLEVGVALDEAALEGLPAPRPKPAAGGDGHEHLDSHVYDLAMPARNPTPYRFVELDWNPGGHEPPGVYDTPHFDFHFYTVERATRDAIDPESLGEARFVEASTKLPPEPERASYFVTASAPGQPASAVPRMGVHWVDSRTPELQGMFGRPESARPFTTTFIHGSWDGRFIFDEPMVTRAFILSRKSAAEAAQRDSVIPLPVAQRHIPAGFYPDAYRVTYDARSGEYRIALTQLAWRE